MNRVQTLERARQIVSADRNKEYGEPEDAFKAVAEFWSTYLDQDIHPSDVAAMMILMKMARIKANWRHEDSWVDIAGYAACGAECGDGQ